MHRNNPGKAFMMQYRALKRRIDALQRAIDDALEGAMGSGISYREKVKSSPKEHDPMASSVARAVDDCATLYEYKQLASKTLREILEAIESLSDERQKEILTRRYINGEAFPDIAYDMHYSESQMYVHHGRALLGINRWLRKKAECEKNKTRDRQSPS